MVAYSTGKVVKEPSMDSHNNNEIGRYETIYLENFTVIKKPTV
jgi:hypothetical protein